MQVHEVGSLGFGVVCICLFDVWPTAGANEQRSIQEEFGLEAESLSPIGYHLASAGSLHNIWIGSAAQLFGTIIDPVQHLRSVCHVVFFDAPPRYAHLAIAAPLPGTDCDAAV